MRLLWSAFVSGVLVLTLGLGAAFAQNPTGRKVYFHVNVPFSIVTDHYTLPAGNYILRQIFLNDRNMFELFRGDMTHSPIAVVTTAPIYNTRPLSRADARIIYRIDEESPDAAPIIHGWTVNGDDGWQIISIVASHKLTSEAAR